MTHRFPIKEIARQAGLGTATVDRVLNGRAHVSQQTRGRVRAAIVELEEQEQQLAARGRRLFIDIVVEAPPRFSSEIRSATNAVLDTMTAGIFRPRYVFQESMPEAEALAHLQRIARRGSHGVCLKARDVASIRQAVNELEHRGIPVITLATDIPATARTAYVGVDNLNAGKTAAYLIAQSRPARNAIVFATTSLESFQGEAERLAGFRINLAHLRPDLRIVEISGGRGSAHRTSLLFERALAEHAAPAAVYSMGGGNSAIVAALAHNHIGGGGDGDGSDGGNGDGYDGSENAAPIVFVAHDLDAENRRLLKNQQLTYVLHHDLQTDLRNVLVSIAARHGLVPSAGERQISDLSVITPFNLDARASLAAL